MSKKTSKAIITNKNQDFHMICFPKFWHDLWQNRHVTIEIKDNSIFVYSVKKEEATQLLIKVANTHYIKLSDEIMQYLNYPNELQLFFCDTYLVLSVSEQEKINIRQRKVEIELLNKKKLQKEKYARMI